MDKANRIIQLRDAVDKLSSLMYNIYVDWKVSQNNPLTNLVFCSLIRNFAPDDKS